jgi:Xaa-Pro aminopeptidase
MAHRVGRQEVIDAAMVARVQSALKEAELDGWLLYDFRGSNPIAAGVVKLPGLVSRRFFVFIPAAGNPTALTHAIEQSPWREWPKGWTNHHYSSWKQLEAALKSLAGGKRVAMEYSAGDAVPYVDRVPAGVIEMVRAAGATIVTSADLVSRFYAVWSPEQRESHERAAKVIAEIAKEGFKLAGVRASTNDPMSEFELRTWIERKFSAAALEIDHGPIVAIGPNAANPHYEPLETGSGKIKRGDILLIDLFAREKNGVYADQTWMASLGEPSARDVKVWEAVRDARDAAIELLRRKAGKKGALKGADVDDAARDVITARGFGEFFIHRTGHSIDPVDLHGSGPNIDNMETRASARCCRGLDFRSSPGFT